MPDSADKNFEPSILPGDGKDMEAIFDSMSAVDLADALEQTLDSMTEETYDGDLISAYLNALDRKAPMSEEPDTEAALKEFQKKVRSFSAGADSQDHVIRKPVRGHRARKVLVTIAATMAILFALLIGAQASGMDVFGALAKWTNEVFHLGASANGDVETYNKIRDALIEHGFPERIVPFWYPEGFTAKEPTIWERDSGVTIEVDFTHPSGKFFCIFFDYFRSSEDVEQLVFEKDDTGVEPYISNNKTFYILSNIDTTSATWSDGLVIETIEGDLSVENIKKMIDSIGV